MTSQQWKVFGLVVQDKTPLPIVAEELGLTIPQIKAMIDEIRKEQPDLFYVDSEKQHFSNKLSGQTRKKYNLKMASYDQRKIGHPDIDTEIKHKF